MIVTGYVPIPHHPRSEEEYHALGRKLLECGNVQAFFVQDIEALPWYRMAQTHMVGLPHGAYPQKDSVEYLSVQHAKMDWLKQAAETIPATDWVVWIDYGIFHLPGITREVVERFLIRLLVRTHGKRNRIIYPSCWDIAGHDGPVNLHIPQWFFCGGVLAVPAHTARWLWHAFRTEVYTIMREENLMTWEVNVLARVAQQYPAMFERYPADHSAEIFTGYKGDEA